MAVKFLLLVNKMGKTRLHRYYTPIQNHASFAGELVRQALRRQDWSCNFFDYKGYRIIFRRYASLYFILGVDDDDNEMEMLELIHYLVETLDRYFVNVCELDIMFSVEKIHYILDGIISCGHILDTNKRNALNPLNHMDAQIRDKV